MLGSAAPNLAERAPHRPQPPFSPAAPSAMRGHRLADVVALPTRTVNTPSLVHHEQPQPVELHLLGGFRLLIGGELVNVGRTGQKLLAVIACRGRQATRSQIAHALWPDTTSDRAHANLRTALYRLFRRAPGAIHATSTHLQLSVGMHIDLEQSTRLANHILSSDIATNEALLAEAMQANLYGDLLPDWDDEWLSDHQYRYRQLRLTALETLSAQLAAAGHHGAAVQAALAAVQADSLRDSAHETLIRACLAQGNRYEAYTHYTTYRRILRDELGLEPPASLGRLLTPA
jgi:DNA-binding SARP family transcriptional activator